MSWIDLHMHSNRSNDADYSPEELMAMCQKSNIKVAALSDHNSVQGVIKAKQASKEYGIELIAAVELDCKIGDVGLHLLGYGINVPNPKIDQLEQDIIKQEQQASDKLMTLVQKLGIAFEKEAVMKLAINGVVTGEMIAEVALNDRRNLENPILKPYYTGGKRSDNPYVNFYWDFCAANKPAYVPINYISLKEAVAIIQESKGIPILAHPGNNIGKNEELLVEIIKQGVKGIEVYSSYHDKETIAFYEKQAEKHNLIKTVGSDYHGKTKPAIQLGSVECNGNEDKIYADLKNMLG